MCPPLIHVSFGACRKFRVVPAALYLEHFASDRTHMLEAGSQIDYQKPPPPFACIVSTRESPLCICPSALLCALFRVPK